MSEKEQLMEEMRGLHTAYLKALGDYRSPEKRKTMVEETLQRLNAFNERHEKGEVSTEEIKKHIAELKRGTEDLEYPKGTCNPECMRNVLRAQGQVIGKAHQKMPPEAGIAMLEMTTAIVMSGIATMVEEANNPKTAPWESRKRVHQTLKSVIEELKLLSNKIDKGEIQATVIPMSPKPKSSNFMN